MSGNPNNADPLTKVVVSEVVANEKKKSSRSEKIKREVNLLIKEIGILSNCMESRMTKLSKDENNDEKPYQELFAYVSDKLINLKSDVEGNLNQAIRDLQSAAEMVDYFFLLRVDVPKKMEVFKMIARNMKDLAELFKKELKESGFEAWSDNDDDDEDDHGMDREPNPKKFKANDGSVHQSGDNQPMRSRKSAVDRSASRRGDGMENGGETLGNAREPEHIVVLPPMQDLPPVHVSPPVLDSVYEDEEEGEDGKDVEDEKGVEDGEDKDEEHPKQGENEKEQPKERDEHQHLQVTGNGKGIEQPEENGVKQNALGEVVDGSEKNEEPQPVEREDEEDDEDKGEEGEQQQQPKVNGNGKGTEQLKQYAVVPHAQEEDDVIEPEEHEEVEPVETEQGTNDQMQEDQPQSSNAGQQFDDDDQPGTSSSASKKAKVSRQEALKEKLSGPLYFTAMCAKAYLQSADLSPAEMERARVIEREIKTFEESGCSRLIGAKDDADFKAFKEVLQNIRRAMDLPPTAANRPSRTQKADSKREGKHRALDLENERANLSFLILTSKLNPALLNSDGRMIVEAAKGFNLKNVYDTTGVILTTTNPRLNNNFFSEKGFNNSYGGKTWEVLKTLCIETSQIKSEEDVKELEGNLEKCSSAILRGIGKSLKVNEKLFTADQLATDAPKLEVEVKTQLATSSWTSKNLSVDKTNPGRETTWKMADKSEFMKLEEAVGVHKQTEEVTREEMERYLRGNESTSTFWHDWNKKLIDVQRNKRSSKMVSHFITNVDITNELFPKQYAEISKLWEFLRPSTRFMSQIDGVISGINGVQAYLKEAGSVTPGHQENLVAASVNWNIGPGECIWYMVPAVFSGKMEAVLAKKSIFPYRTPYWPLEEALQNEKISYEKIVQKPDDMIVVGVGTYHWVQANGPCVNISWNVAERTETQLMAMALFNDHAVSQQYSPVLPLEAMIWNDAKSCQLENAGYDKLRLSLLTRSLARCQNEFEYAVEVKALEPTPIGEYLQSGISQESRELTNNPMCGNPTCPRRMLFNFFCVTQSRIIVCIGCYNEQSINRKCYFKHTIEDLIVIFNKYRAAMLSQGTS